MRLDPLPLSKTNYHPILRETCTQKDTTIRVEKKKKISKGLSFVITFWGKHGWSYKVDVLETTEQDLRMGKDIHSGLPKTSLRDSFTDYDR